MHTSFRSMLKVQKLRYQWGTRITITWPRRNTHLVRSSGGYKNKSFFLKKHPPKIQFYIDLNQYCHPHPPAVSTHSVRTLYNVRTPH